jgi:ribosome-associated toxin RatA of RatAB toxin-antitoxin module
MITVVKKSALVKFSAQQMFDIVNNIESYPDYLPWCQTSRILNQKKDMIEAELVIAKGGLQKAFATRNQLDQGGRIYMTLLEGPFKSLEGVWNFMPLRQDASKISLDLEFEVAGKLASLTFGRIFNQLCNNMVSAFSDRARQIYG